jgi:hypothetical protein
LFEGPNNVTWGFNVGTGGTGFPTLNVQRGDNPSGTIQGQTLLFGDNTKEAIITTPNGNVSYPDSQRLVINPGAGADGTSGEGGDIYLWAGRGGDASGTGGDIKIRGGQGGANTSGGLGGDGGYIRIEAGDAASTGGYAGYIDITGGSSNAVGGYVTITGGSGPTQGGDANINGGYTNSGPGGRVNINGGGSGSGLSQYGNINIVSGASTWTFNNTGNIVLPQGGVVYETNIPVGSLSGKTIALAPYGGTSADQQLLVYPTAVPDANHLHLTSGNLYNTELFLGDDNLYVKLANTGNIVINSNDGIGNSAQWNFATTGELTTPGSGGTLTLTGGNIAGANVVGANSVNVAGNVTVSGWVDGANTYFTGAIAGNVLTVTGAVDGTIARGQTIYGNTIAGNTVITLQLTQSSANAGGNGTYRVTNTQTVGAETMSVNSLYMDGDLKLAADHGIYVRDSHDPYQYDNLIGISEVDATILVGSINTNGVAIDNDHEYKVDSALNPGTYMAVAKVDATDNVILSSGNANTTQIRVGGDSIHGGFGYAQKFFNGGEAHIPTGLRIGDNINSTAYGAALEVTTNAYSGGSFVSYKDSTGDPYGSFVFGARYHGNLNAPQPVQQHDWIMEFGAGAWDGTNLNGGGELAWLVDGAVSPGVNPSRAELYVTPQGSANQTLGLKVDSTLTVTTYGPIVTGPVPYANLTAVAGSRAFINNGNLVAAGNFGAQVSGGGSNTVPVWSDGTHWYIG